MCRAIHLCLQHSLRPRTLTLCFDHRPIALWHLQNMALQPACAGSKQWWHDKWAADVLENDICKSLKKRFDKAVAAQASDAYLLALVHVGMRHILSHRGVDVHSIAQSKMMLQQYPFAETAHISAHVKRLNSDSPLLQSNMGAGVGSTDGQTAAQTTGPPGATVLSATGGRQPGLVSARGTQSRRKLEHSPLKQKRPRRRS